jgi:hypothetical protein
MLIPYVYTENMGQCFGDIRQFSTKNSAFFLKTKVMIQFLYQLLHSILCKKKVIFSRPFLAKNHSIDRRTCVGEIFLYRPNHQNLERKYFYARLNRISLIISIFSQILFWRETLQTILRDRTEQGCQIFLGT